MSKETKMLINQQNCNTNFKALHIANCNNLKIYKLNNKQDLKFIKQLPEKINLKNLMPNLNKFEYDRWKEMLQYAVDNAQFYENSTYLGVKNNKPCGIITFLKDKITELDCICTWPVEHGKKVKLAGQTLFYQMFLDFLEINGKKIKLEAITNGPFDTVKKYKKLGFKELETLPTKIKMEITNPKVKSSLKEMSENLSYENIEPEQIDLSKSLDI